MRGAPSRFIRATFYLTLAVVSLSCVLFIADQISTDIARYVKENDTAALTLHNQLQAHGAAIDEAVKKKDADDLLALQNSQPALQIKEELQKFATNTTASFSRMYRASAGSRVCSALARSAARTSRRAI